MSIETTKVISIPQIHYGYDGRRVHAINAIRYAELLRQRGLSPDEISNLSVHLSHGKNTKYYTNANTVVAEVANPNRKSAVRKALARATVQCLTMRGNYVQSDASEAKVINSLDSWRSQALTDHENLQARARILARSLKEDQVIIKSLTSAEL